MINNLGTAVPPGRPGAPRVPRGRCRATPQPAQGGRRLPAARAGDRRSIGRGGAADLRRVPRRQRRPGDRERAQPRCDPLPVGAAARSEPAPPRRWLAGFDGPGDLGQPPLYRLCGVRPVATAEVLADPDDVAAGHVPASAGPARNTSCGPASRRTRPSCRWRPSRKPSCCAPPGQPGAWKGGASSNTGSARPNTPTFCAGGSGARTARARWRATPKHGRSYYRCVTRRLAPGSTALAAHPRNVYLPEPSVLPALNAWIGELFNRDHIDQTVAALLASQDGGHAPRALATPGSTGMRSSNGWPTPRGACRGSCGDRSRSGPRRPDRIAQRRPGAARRRASRTPRAQA